MVQSPLIVVFYNFKNETTNATFLNGNEKLRIKLKINTRA